MSPQHVPDDDADIRNFLARLAHLTDHGEVDSLMELWADDAVWQRAATGEVVRGRDAIRAMTIDRRSQGIAGPGSSGYHLATTVLIDVHGDGTATAHSYLVFVRVKQGVPAIGLVAHYEDLLRRHPAGWQLAVRTMIEHHDDRVDATQRS